MPWLAAVDHLAKLTEKGARLVVAQSQDLIDDGDDLPVGLRAGGHAVDQPVCLWHPVRAEDLKRRAAARRLRQLSRIDDEVPTRKLPDPLAPVAA